MGTRNQRHARLWDPKRQRRRNAQRLHRKWLPLMTATMTMTWTWQWVKHGRAKNWWVGNLRMLLKMAIWYPLIDGWLDRRTDGWSTATYFYKLVFWSLESRVESSLLIRSKIAKHREDLSRSLLASRESRHSVQGSLHTAGCRCYIIQQQRVYSTMLKPWCQQS